MKKCIKLANKNVSPAVSAVDKTRTKILQAAAKLFAEKGFSGASLSAIAKTAKITQSLIHHHFINKEKLWKEVKSSFCAQLNEKLQPSVEPVPKNLKTFLTSVVTSHHELFTQYPQALRMRYWQRLENHSNQKKLHIDPHYNEYLQTMENDIHTLQQKGEIASGLDAKFIILMINGIIHNSFDLALFYPRNNQQKKQEYLTFVINSLYQSLKK